MTVVGVHTPEFGFERNVDNIVPRARDFKVDYPIAIDSDYGVWQAFANHYWPALYVADAEGRIRYHHFGEGEYAMTEMVVQQLLLEAGAEGFDRELVAVDPRASRSPPTGGRSVARDVPRRRQESGFASPDRERFDQPHRYPAPSRLALNQWAPSGTWTLAQHAAVLNEPGGRIAFRFQARDVNLVMGPQTRGASIPFRVLLDGTSPGADHGDDVDEAGNGTLADQRLYQLIRQGDTGRRSPLRDRVPRRGRRGVLLHLRLSGPPVTPAG